jgi:hypothetical protein
MDYLMPGPPRQSSGRLVVVFALAAGDEMVEIPMPSRMNSLVGRRKSSITRRHGNAVDSRFGIESKARRGILIA